MSKGFNLKEVILIILATAFLTSLTTGIIVYNQNKLTKNLTYKDLSEDTDLKNFLDVYASLIDQYYENVDKEKLLESAINAMFNYLGEDYSTYMNKEETQALAEQLLGECQGIGISLNSEKEIVGFIKGGSAQESGLQIGDKIIEMNHEDITNLTSSELAKKISDMKKGEKIAIKVQRAENTFEYQVENKRLLIPAIESKILNENIGYLKITTFSNTLKEQVDSSLKELENSGIQSLIIDVRNNTGGYLSAANDVASMFLEKGKIIYSLEEKDDVKEYKDTTDEKRDYKIVMLFNDNSASASEILIAALKDNQKCVTVGIDSYGKGKVQQTHSLNDGSMIKYTTARWLTPNGTCIDGQGIAPDYYLEDDETTEEDEQLLKAVELAQNE